MAKALSRVIAIRRRSLTVERGVAVKEGTRHQRQAVPRRRQDGPVLGPWQMMEAHRIPQDDVGIDDRALVRGIVRQSISARILVREEAGGVELARVVGGCP